MGFKVFLKVELIGVGYLLVVGERKRVVVGTNLGLDSSFGGVKEYYLNFYLDRFKYGVFWEN